MHFLSEGKLYVGNKAEVQEYPQREPRNTRDQSAGDPVGEMPLLGWQRERFWRVSHNGNISRKCILGNFSA